MLAWPFSASKYMISRYVRCASVGFLNASKHFLIATGLRVFYLELSRRCHKPVWIEQQQQKNNYKSGFVSGLNSESKKSLFSTPHASELTPFPSFCAISYLRRTCRSMSSDIPSYSIETISSFEKDHVRLDVVLTFVFFSGRAVRFFRGVPEFFFSDPILSAPRGCYEFLTASSLFLLDFLRVCWNFLRVCFFKKT